MKEAIEYDRLDSLKEFRKEFFSGNDSVIYMDGNSLGRLPLAAADAISMAVNEQWGERMIRSWNDSWWEMPVRAALLISKIIGAKESEVIVCDSTSINLYKLATAALRLKSDRRKIISESTNFPTDLYILQGIADNLDMGHQIVLAESRDGLGIDYSDFEDLIDADTAIVVLTLVSYKSAQMHNMKKINELAHEFGALVIWDLCHAVGAVPVDLNMTGADMAVGCTYKYLNCGPGSPSFVYVRSELQPGLDSPIWGWFGDSSPFDFKLQYTPAESVKKYMAGTSGILSMCTIEPALEIFIRAGMDRIREKSVKMTEFFIRIYNEVLNDAGYRLGSPLDSGIRGSHVSLRHSEAYRISKALIDSENGDYIIIPDFRPPDNLRFGFAPLYNTFSEIVKVASELLRIIRDNEIVSYTSDRDDVT